MRTELIAANWKMNLTRATATELARSVKRAFLAHGGGGEREVLLAPPYPYLGAVREVLEGSTLLLAGQDVSRHDAGAYTSEVSAAMLLDLGCRYAIVGHSERREYCGDTDEIVGAKLRRAFDSRLGVILCVGEKEEQRDRGEERAVVQRQLDAALGSVSPEEAGDLLVVAYEPVWAIGTGKTATAADAAAMHLHIREVLGTRFGGGIADGLRILYGGSVKPSNAAELLGVTDIDGVLVGGASLDAESFTAIYSA